jgi:hypothetical protein
MKAIVTTSQAQFQLYCHQHQLTENDAKQVSVLSDVQNQTYSEAILIAGSDNVTWYVIDRIKKT